MNRLRTICAVTEPGRIVAHGGGARMTTIQTPWTSGRTVIVIVEAILLLIGAALAEMPQGETMLKTLQPRASSRAARSAAPPATAPA